MTTKHTPATPLPRIIRAAAALDVRYSNPSVAARNRADHAKRHSIKAFWQSVMRALYRPYACQSWTNDDMRVWDAIRARQALLRSLGEK